MPPIKLSRRLTTQDAAFLYGESESGPLHFGGLGFFDDAIDFPRMLDHVERRLHMLPRFRQRLAFAPFNLAHPTLEDDPDFKIENHLFCHELPEDAGEAQMTEAVLRIFEPPLDRHRPLWEMHLFHGLEGRRSAVLWKVHHCIVDGVSWVEVLTTLFDLRRDPAAAPAGPAWETKPVPSAARLLGDAAFDLAQTELNAARNLFGRLLPTAEKPEISGTTDARKIMRALRPAVSAPWNRGVVTKARSFGWLRYAYSDVRTIRKAFGGTVNDVVLAALGEGAARYLRHHGCNPRDLPLRIGCPVSVRKPEEMESLGNRVSMMFVELEAEPMDPVARLKAVSNETGRIKSANEPKALDRLMAAADLVPPSLIGLLSSLGTGVIDTAARLAERAPSVARMIAPRFPVINFIATNVRGPQLPAYLAGHMMLDYVGLIPLGADLGCGVVISTYNQNLYIALMAAPNLMPDVELMKAYVDDAFRELKLAAEEAAPKRASAVLETQPQAASRHQLETPLASVGKAETAAAG